MINYHQASLVNYKIALRLQKIIQPLRVTILIQMQHHTCFLIIKMVMINRACRILLSACTFFIKQNILVFYPFSFFLLIEKVYIRIRQSLTVKIVQKSMYLFTLLLTHYFTLLKENSDMRE